jgi:hypothetical protein
MSKFDKLLQRICSLSKDMRFDELKKVLESYGYIMHPKAEAVIIHSASPEKCQSRYQSMSQLKRFMFKWSKKLSKTERSDLYENIGRIYGFALQNRDCSRYE